MNFAETLKLIITGDGAGATATLKGVGAEAEKSLAGAEAAGAKLGLGMIAATAAIGGALIKAAGDATDYGMAVGKLQRLTGGSAQEMSGLAFAAQQTGTDIDALGKAIAIASKNIESGKFEKFGFDARNADGSAKPFEETLGQVADRFMQLGDSTERANLAQQLFGRGGTAVIGMLKDGKEGLSNYIDEARKYGLILDDAGIKKAREMKAAQRDLAAAMQGVWNQIGQTVQPVLTTIMNDTSEVIAGMRSLITGARDEAQSLADKTDAVFKKNAFADIAPHIDRVKGAIEELKRQRDELGNSPVDIVAKKQIENQIGALSEVTVKETEYHNAIIARADSQGISNEQAKAAIDAEKKQGQSLEDVTEAQEKQEKATAEASKELDKITTATDKAASAFNRYFDEQMNGLSFQGDFDQSMRDIAKSLTEHGNGLNWITNQIDLTSEAGIKNRDAFVTSARMIQEEAGRIAATDPSAARARFLELSDSLRTNLLPMFGNNKLAVDNLLASLHLTAGDWDINVKTTGLTQAQAELNNFIKIAQGAGIDPQLIQGYANARTDPRAGWGGRYGGAPGHASGTPSTSSGWALVGENGPEWAKMPGGSQVYDARTSASMTVGAGGGTQTLRIVNANNQWVMDCVVEHLAGTS